MFLSRSNCIPQKSPVNLCQNPLTQIRHQQLQNKAADCLLMMSHHLHRRRTYLIKIKQRYHRTGEPSMEALPYHQIMLLSVHEGFPVERLDDQTYQSEHHPFEVFEQPIKIMTKIES